MPCYSPLQAWQRANGDVVFVERGDIQRELSLPCGQCTWCRLQRAHMWSVRCMHEASLHKENAFITLTYDDAYVPDCGLQYRDFQLFMKRLRKHVGERKNIRFYMCGEYGENFGRPHYHALIFGERFNDRVFWRTSGSGEKSYRSDVVERLWKLGHSEVGDVTHQSAAYVARYCLKKVTGPNADAHYQGRTPEFCRMSLKPGIGRDWYSLYSGDLYPHDFAVANGKELKVPKYYDKILKREDPDMHELVRSERELRGVAAMADNTPARLKVKEEVAKARLRFYQREIQ